MMEAKKTQDIKYNKLDLYKVLNKQVHNIYKKMDNINNK